VDNVVHANVLSSQADDVSGLVFNVACGEQITVKQVLFDIAALMGCEVCPLYQPSRAGDVRHSLADISAARQRLKFSPQTYFAEGLAATVRDFVSECSNTNKGGQPGRRIS